MWSSSISQWCHFYAPDFVSTLIPLFCLSHHGVSVSPSLGALDGFTSAKPATAVKPTATSKATSVTDQAEEDETEDGQLDDEFKNSLAAGMEELMKEMNGNSELQKSFEEMFKGLGVDGKAPEAPSTASETAAAAAAGGAPGESFQDRIAKTMGKLKESSDEVDVSWSCFFCFEKNHIFPLHDLLAKDPLKIKPSDRTTGLRELCWDHTLFRPWCISLLLRPQYHRKIEDTGKYRTGA